MVTKSLDGKNEALASVSGARVRREARYGDTSVGRTIFLERWLSARSD